MTPKSGVIYTVYTLPLSICMTRYDPLCENVIIHKTELWLEVTNFSNLMCLARCWEWPHQIVTPSVSSNAYSLCDAALPIDMLYMKS